MTSGHIFDNDQPGEYERLVAMQSTYDPGTIRHLENLGVSEGWHCLEVGAGAGSIASWLCRQVGNTGRVVATDVNPRFLYGIADSNLEVWQHDITVDPLPVRAFEIVHVRLLLDSLRERDKALDKLASALKPGGWIIVEEFDHTTLQPDPSIGEPNTSLFLKIKNSLIQLWEPDGYDAYYGQKVPSQLLSRGLEQIGGEGRAFLRLGGSPGTMPWRLSVEQKRMELIRNRFASANEVDDHLIQLEDPKLIYLSPLMIASWGRQPIQ